MQDAITALYHMRQGPHELNEHYMDCFKSNITAIKHTKGDHIFFSPGLTGNERATATADSIHIEEESNNALLLLRDSDEHRYKGLIGDLRKSALLDRDKYLTTVANMYEVMVKYNKSTVNSTSRNTNQGRAGTVLTHQQVDTHDENAPQSLTPGNDG